MAEKKSKPVMEFEDVYSMSPSSEFEDVVAQYDSNPVPTISKNINITPSDRNKLVEFLSGGKATSFGQWAYGGEKPKDSTLGKASQLIQQSGIEGLSGIAPVGQLESAVTAIGSKIPNIAPLISKITSPVTSRLSQIPAQYMGWMSGRDPEAYKTIYEISKSGDKALKQAVKESTPLGKKLSEDAVYNYTRSMFNAPHEVAITAEDFTRGTNPRGLGAWDVGADRAYREFPNLPAAVARAKSAAYKSFNELSDADKLKQAIQAGIDTSTWLPFKAGDNAWTNIGKVAKSTISPPPLELLASPRISRGVSSAAGTTARYAGQAGNILAKTRNVLPDPTLENIFKYGLLSPYMIYEQGQ